MTDKPEKARYLAVRPPVPITNKFKRICNTNGYSNPFAMSTAVFMFIQATHAERMQANEDMRMYHKKVIDLEDE